jgi:hypothetical protein
MISEVVDANAKKGSGNFFVDPVSCAAGLFARVLTKAVRGW